MEKPSDESLGRVVRKEETPKGLVECEGRIEIDSNCGVVVVLDATGGFERLQVATREQGSIFLLCLEAINLLLYLLLVHFVDS